MKKIKKFQNIFISNKILYSLIGVWIIAILLSGNFFFLLITLLFIIASVLVRKSFWTLLSVILIFSIIYLTPFLDAFIEFTTVNIATLSHPKKPLRLILTPNSGKEVLNHDVLEMLGMIDSNQLLDFTVSPTISLDEYTKQRIVESAWPIRNNPEAKFIFVFENELAKYQSCNVLDQRELIYLVNCN